MKRYVYHVFGLMSLVLFLNCGTKTPSASLTSKNSKLTTKQLGETITSDELKEHLYIYASDEFEGRETGTEGQKKAVNYLKSNYEKLEISGALTDESYFQKVPLKYLKSSSAALSGSRRDLLRTTGDCSGSGSGSAGVHRCRRGCTGASAGGGAAA